MTPAARLSAVIEILDEIARSHGPADGVIKAWARPRRYAGSGDRRAIAARIYDTLRARALIAWRMGADDGRALVLGAVRWLDGATVEEMDAVFTGEGHAPAPLTAEERERLSAPPQDEPDWVKAGAPEWLAPKLAERLGDDWVAEVAAMTQPRAPLDLRVNALRGDVDKALNLLKYEEVEPERTPLSALGLRLPAEFATDIQKTRAYATGWIEVQDEGSQMAAWLADAQAGWTVVDYCAGGGGKTLALAQSMQNRGRLVASDVNTKRLDAIKERVERAGAAADIRTLGQDGQGMIDLAGKADLVVVDAPCSGSGTWRRRPEAPWRLTPGTLARFPALQLSILSHAADLVRPGGRLVYITCSVFAEENDEVAAAFAAAHPEFRPRPIAEAAAATSALTPAGQARLAELAKGGHTLQLTPLRSGTDGFFVALFERSR